MIPSHYCRRLISKNGSTSMFLRSSTNHRSATILQHFFASDTPSTAEDTTMGDQKRRLAQAALAQIPKHGWTQDALTAAVMEDSQMSISMSGLWTPIELVHWLMDDWNQQLSQRQSNASQRLSTFDAIQWRLQQVIPLVQANRWHEGMALGLSTPLTTRSQLHEFIELAAPTGASTVYKTGLGSIFLSTELFLLTDTSKDHEATWEFLKSRLTELDNGEMVHIVDMEQIMNTIRSSTGSILGNGNSSNNNNVPVAAAAAIASSLLEGAASLLRPPPASAASTRREGDGTKASDYKPR